MTQSPYNAEPTEREPMELIAILIIVAIVLGRGENTD